MRKPFSDQLRLDCPLIAELELNLNCRDEIIPLLAGLKHVYSQPRVREEILDLVAQDVNAVSRSDRGREGLDYWQITVLAAARLGCNFDYDKLQDLAEQHRALRQMMGIGDWQAGPDFNWRRIHDNICLLQPETITAINHALVEEGYRLEPDAVTKQRADSFVVETNIHYPTESSLIVDGVRKIIGFCAELDATYELSGWRQHRQLLRKVKQTNREIARIAHRKGSNYKDRMVSPYRSLLDRTKMIIERAEATCETLERAFELDLSATFKIDEIKRFIGLTRQVCDTARRRVLEGEKVPNADKLFSLFETHTQLYRRGKVAKPNQLGRLVLVFEDKLGFISHHCVMNRDEGDKDVAVNETRKVQTRLKQAIKELSLDRGFHSPTNQIELSEIVNGICLPKPGVKQSAVQLQTASVTFHQARQRHSGVESAIGALQSGNGLVRCRDVGEVGFERYVALAILGRNIQSLGKLILSRQHPDSAAALTKRAA
jgi:IS5 family transposase